MVQSLNTKVDFTIEATSYLGIASYGKVMVGDKAFEFYNEKNGYPIGFLWLFKSYS